MAKPEITFDPEITGGVVVGYDGSATSTAALAWAAEEAGLRVMRLHVVRAWVLSTAIAEVGAPFGTVPSLQECEDAVEASTRRAVEGLAADSVEIVQHVVHAAPGRVMLAAAQHADLLVVGERGTGGFRGLSLGSIAEQALRHAPCTVVVVRPREQ